MALQFNMNVVKRDGSKEEVSFDKVLNRIKNLSNELSVNAVEIAQKVCSRIYDGVRTSELDELAAYICSSLIIEHPDYDTMASRIIVSNHHKNTSPSFSETVQLLYDNINDTGDRWPLVSEKLYEITMKHKEKINSYIDYERDYQFSFFGFKTLETSYLFRKNDRVVERPQHMFMRVAIGIHGDDFKDALDTYDFMSLKYFVHATPTLFNAGTPSPQLSSCFLGGMHDSIDGIYRSLHECAHISKYAGGIGLHIHNIRGKDSIIRGTNGKSTGIIPMLRVFNNTARYVNQSGRRNGSIAMYIEPWHPDIINFLMMKKNHGVEEERARDLFYALWIPDLFMKRVQSGAMWSLMCPDKCKDLPGLYGDEFEARYLTYESEGKYVRQIPAKEVWMKMMESQIETGTPYMLYKDHVNRKTNQQNLGTIRSSNLCVAGDTKILTKQGYYRIETLMNEEIEVWNGFEWSKTKVFMTSPRHKLIRVHLSNGLVIRCTPYHKFIIKEKEKERFVSASALRIGMPLSDFNVPIIREYAESIDAEIQLHVFYDEKTSYTMGVVAGASEEVLTIEGEDVVSLSMDRRVPRNLNMMRSINYADGKPASTEHGYDLTLNAPYDKNMARFLVPINTSLDTRLAWLSGFIDGAGKTRDNPSALYMQVRDIVAADVFYMLQTMGVQPVIEYDRNANKVIVITAADVTILRSCGLKCNRVDLEMFSNTTTNNAIDPICIKGVVDLDEYEPTYCFKEELRSRGMFGGVVLGNCTEIMEYSDENETAVCNLASICLPTFVKDGHFDYSKLHEVVKKVTKNLNKVIDINLYPVEKARRSNLRHRPIGIGVQGLADTYVKMRLAFESDGAMEVNRMIFETIYHASLEQSMEIAKRRGEILLKQDSDRSVQERTYANMNEFEHDLSVEHQGAYATFGGSPASLGVLQFDMWGVTPNQERYDWNGLKKDIMRFGLRNSLLVAPMPTASTSQIMGFNEAFEPFTSNIYKRKTLAGEFIIINKYLIRDLITQGLWSKSLKDQIVLGDGSIQHIKEIPDNIRELYKVVWEIKQRNVIDQAVDRGAFICQSQSMNLFVDDPSFQKLTTMYFYSWSKGLKTGLYYLRTKPKASAQKFTIEPKRDVDEETCLTCSA